MHPVNPALIDVPVPIRTPRLIIRPVQAGDGPRLNAAVVESLETLKPWMPWAQKAPTLEESEALVTRASAQFLQREDLMVLLTDRKTGEILGGSGLHRIKWHVPSFEIGYWIRRSREGQGLVSESTNALTRFAFEALGAKRVEIRCDEKNHRSLKVMQTLGFEREGLLRNEDRDPSGELRNTLIYARNHPDGLADLDVTWG